MPRNEWKETVRLADVFHNEEMDFPERRDAIVARIKHTKWYQLAAREDAELFYVIDELADTEGADEFDCVWNYVYDIADGDRVWIATV